MRTFSLGGYLILEGSIFSVSCFVVEITGVGCGEEVAFFISHKGKGRCTFLLLKLQCFQKLLGFGCAYSFVWFGFLVCFL